MRKFILVISLLVHGTFTMAQNGLENITVEKYYISNAADSAGSIGILPVGSVTYRIYADMLPGYKFQAAYGVPGHTLILSTSTTFFNNEDRGATTPTYSKTNARANTVMLDSWLSVGAGCAGNFGILKSEDNATGGTIVVNNTVPPILQNADPLAGIPLTTQDGLYTGIPEAVTTVGLTPAELAIFDNVSQTGSLLSTSNGSWASLNGSSGPIPATNRVLIAQMTTNGVFHFELNIQIGTPTAGVQNFVALNPVGAEISIPSLIGTFSLMNILPTVNITSPSGGASFTTGANIPITANAADADGTIDSVVFFIDGVSVGLDNSYPFSVNYTGTTGTHTLTARATDNNGGHTTSSGVTINVNNNPPPTVNITAPSNGAIYISGDPVNIAATATANGTVASVEFFVDGVSVGIDNTFPYTANYTAVLGSHALTVRVTDNLAIQVTSSPVNITVNNNIPPTVNITAPSNGATFTAPAVVTVTANANDLDGTVASVEYFVNGISIGIDNTSPYSMNWTSVIGPATLTARVTDNRGATTTSGSVSISIANPNALPYSIITSSNTCFQSSFCLPVTAVDTVRNVIGYDITLHYNKAKVQPTGIITIGNSLINPAYVDYIDSVDTVGGNINISLFFNANAPANANFNGIGNVFCVEFNKTSNFTSADTTQFSISFLQESYFSGVNLKLVDPGKYISYKDSLFHGALRFWTNNSPIRYNSSNPVQYLITNIYGNNDSCNHMSSVAVQPDTSGNFNFNVSNGHDINIQKDILPTTSVQPVINGFDALLARKVLLNDLSFIPSVYQILAMDVNLDGVISAGDVSQINQRAVLMIPEFRQAWNYNNQGVSNGQLSKDWIFADSVRLNTNLSYRISTTYPLDNGVGYSKSRVPVVPFCLPLPITNIGDCPLINSETYKGILLGDINGNYATVSPNNIFRLNAGNKIVFDMSQAVITGTYADVPVFISSDKVINALDFSIKYNEANLTFYSVIDHTGYMQSLANYNATDKTLRFTSNSLSNYEIGKPLMSVRFVLNDGKVNDKDLNSMEGFLNGDRVVVEIMNSRVSSGSQNNDQMASIYPNPASGILNVVVAEDASIQLFGMEGKQVLIQSNVHANQQQVINVQNLANGIYLMKIFNDRFVSIKKIVIKN